MSPVPRADPYVKARAESALEVPEEAQDGNAEAHAEPRVQRVAHLRRAQR